MSSRVLIAASALCVSACVVLLVVEIARRRQNVPRWAIQSRTLFALTTDPFNYLGTVNIYLEQWSLFDGMGRIAQTNRPSPSGGRVVNRTVYDSSGRVLWESQPIYQSGTAAGATWWLGGTPTVPRAVRYT